MTPIKLSNSQKVAFIDDLDRDKISGYTWWLSGGYATSGYYLGTRKTGRKWKCVRLHQLILSAPSGFIVDHENGIKLDCRRKNLRLATARDNSRNMRQNARKTSVTLSRFKGVSFDNSRNRWTASITVNYRHILIGRFDKEVYAAKAYNLAAIKHFGAFARLNTFRKAERGDAIKPPPRPPDRRRNLRIVSVPQFRLAQKMRARGMGYREIAVALGLPDFCRQAIRNSLIRKDYFFPHELSA